MEKIASFTTDKNLAMAFDGSSANTRRKVRRAIGAECEIEFGDKVMAFFDISGVRHYIAGLN